MDASSGPENRLAGALSPYLLLHQHNPVDWYPWGPEALERARREAKPIFLSVGYSTCYWCHVMERESFSDPATAEVMNRHFVNIKVDREERPELDEIYMAATQLLTRHGGWPNSVFLTPKLEPFFAGTYFPPEPRHGQPGFRQLLEGMARAWAEQREEVERQAGEVARSMRLFLEQKAEPGRSLPGPEAAERSLTALAGRFDPRWGGFGAAPKFPSPGNLFLLAEMAPEKPEAGRMLSETLDHMARGGIYDQLAGGFHRYATDREWKVPHFEKMLYDNGLLLEIYAREHARTGEGEWARVARETAAFLDRELGAPEGGFWSAIDAEVDGHEGGHHSWRREEIEEVLGEEDAAFLAPILGFDGPAFFEGAYVLHLPQPIAVQAGRRKTSPEELWRRIRPFEEALHRARLERELPLTDDKVLTDWNGMAITGLAVAGRVLGDRELVARAARAADFVLAHLRDGEGVLLHRWRRGRAGIEAFLSDYVFFVRGLLALHEAGGEERWLARAAELTRQQVERLGDPAGGFYVSGEREDVLFRSKEAFDGALPAANAVAVTNLLRLAELEEEGEWRRLAASALRAFGSLIEAQPEAARMLALATRRYHALAGEWTPDEGAPAADLAAEAREVVRAEVSAEPAGEDGFRSFELRVEVAPGWHLYAHSSGSEHAVPTVLEARGGELRGLVYPAGAPRREAGGGEVRIYAGSFAVRGEVQCGEGGALVLRYSPCDERRCLPAAALEIPL